MTDQHAQRPWYVNERLCDDWVTVEEKGGDLRMLKLFKIARSIIVNLGIISITLVALWLGGDVNILGSLGLFVLAAYNGVEVLDYLSLAQAIVEVQRDDRTGDNE